MPVFCCYRSRRRDKQPSSRCYGSLTPVSVPLTFPLHDAPSDQLQTHQFIVQDGSGNEKDRSWSAARSKGSVDCTRITLSGYALKGAKARHHVHTAFDPPKEWPAPSAATARHRQTSHQNHLGEGNDESRSSSHHKITHCLSLIEPVHPGLEPWDAIEFALDDDIILPDIFFSRTQESSYESDNCSDVSLHISQLCGAEARTNERQLHPDKDVDMSSTATAAQSCRPSTAFSMSPNRQVRCSFNSSRLNRVFDLDNDFDIRRGSHAWEDQSALGIWLIARGIRPTTRSSIRAEDTGLENSESKSHLRSPSSDLGGIDSVIDVSAHSQESSLIESSHWTDHRESCTPNRYYKERANNDCPLIYSRVAKEYPKINSLEPVSLALKWSPDNMSSNYPSVQPSFQPSPAVSMNHQKYSLNPPDTESLELSPLQWPENFPALRNFGNSEGQSSYATAEDNSPPTWSQATVLPARETDPRTEYEKFSAPFDASQGDVELLSTEEKLRQVLPQRRVDFPQRSRFREEFPTSAPQAPVKNSFMKKIQNSISRLSQRIGPDVFGPSDNSYSSASVFLDAEQKSPDTRHGDDKNTGNRYTPAEKTIIWKDARRGTPFDESVDGQINRRPGLSQELKINQPADRCPGLEATRLCELGDTRCRTMMAQSRIRHSFDRPDRRALVMQRKGNEAVQPSLVTTSPFTKDGGPSTVGTLTTPTCVEESHHRRHPRALSVDSSTNFRMGLCGEESQGMTDLEPLNHWFDYAITRQSDKNTVAGSFNGLASTFPNCCAADEVGRLAREVGGRPTRADVRRWRST